MRFVVDVWRCLIHPIAMPKGKKDRDDNDFIRCLVKEISELTCAVRGLTKEINKPKPKNRLNIAFGQDQPIPKDTMKLSKPIKPGFRRPFTITPDEPVDLNDTGTYVKVENVAGDSTVTIDPTSTASSIKGFINGDGATGDKAVRFVADGHLGDGDQPVSLDVEFTVATPDATILGFAEGATDEPIPA